MRWRIARLTEAALTAARIEHLKDGWKSADKPRQIGSGPATAWVLDMVDAADRCGPLDKNCCGCQCQCGKVCLLNYWGWWHLGCKPSPEPQI